jgi:hypothetical protein
MSLPVDVLSLLLYCVQQLGVMLGVGAQTVILVSYLLAARDGTIDQKEEQFSRVVVQVLKFGFYFIVASGAAITCMHLAAGQIEIVFTPAFVFKWVLIGVIGAVTFMVGRAPFMHFFWEGILGAHWYALFVIHVVAPLTTWPDLIVLYVLWALGFVLFWNALVYTLQAPRAAPHFRGREAAPAQKVTVKEQIVAPKPVESPRIAAMMTAPKPQPSAPKPAAVLPPAPKKLTPPPPKPAVSVPHKPEELLAPLPVAIKTNIAVSTPPVIPLPQKPLPKKSVLPVPEKPIEDPDKNPGLPAIRVMPTNAQEVDRQMRASVVQFD